MRFLSASVSVCFAHVCMKKWLIVMFLYRGILWRRSWPSVGLDEGQASGCTQNHIQDCHDTNRNNFESVCINIFKPILYYDLSCTFFDTQFCFRSFSHVNMIHVDISHLLHRNTHHALAKTPHYKSHGQNNFLLCFVLIWTRQHGTLVTCMQSVATCTVT